MSGVTTTRFCRTQAAPSYTRPLIAHGDDPPCNRIWRRRSLRPPPLTPRTLTIAIRPLPWDELERIIGCVVFSCKAKFGFFEGVERKECGELVRISYKLPTRCADPARNLETTPCTVEAASEINGLRQAIGSRNSTRRIFARTVTRIPDPGSGCVSFGRDDFDVVTFLNRKSVDQLLGKNHGKIVIPFEHLHTASAGSRPMVGASPASRRRGARCLP